MSEAEMIKDNKKCRDMMSPAINRIKRGLDILGSITGMIVFSPLFLLIYLVIKIENGGKVIFSQERIGYQGKPFILYKFRSMKESAEADGKPALCCQGDKRLTRVGRFLREHHLDELPQLWNVLKGILITNCFINYVRDCFRLQPSTTDIPTTWKRCYDD